MANLFNSIQLFKPKKNVFDLSHDVKLSFDMGQLIPVMNLECVPGDKFNISCETLIRFAPLIAPVMHRMDVYVHYFFVPYRILWPSWEEFITADNTGSAPVIPSILLDNSNSFSNSLNDYLGLPEITGANQIPCVAFSHAAYQKIFQDYYRDQNVGNSVNWELTDGDNTSNTDLLSLHNRAWEHDYFTSALPFAQKGNAVDIPLGNVQIDEARVLMNTAGTGGATTLTGTAGNPIVGKVHTGDPDIGVDNLYAEAQTAPVTPTTVNDLRRAFRLQEWLERNARGGTRYIESILAHFGVKSSDKRLQRPEYITGIKSPITVSEVLNSTGETGGLPQGNMAGHAIGVASGKYGQYFCEEHGVIMGIMSVMPKTCYQQGVPRQFRKYDNLDYYWPSFANLGEQEILASEIYADATNIDSVFGYIPRYAEYKNIPSKVAGEFRNNLSYWHLGRIFNTEPQLNEPFITSDPDPRIFAVVGASNAHMYCHILNKVSAVRGMPKFGVPSI